MSRKTVLEDAELTQLLRSVMADRSEPMPPAGTWEPIRSRLHELRRRRRIRSAARVGAGLLAVTAVIAAVNVRFTTGAIETSQPARPALAGEPVRGSLASDSAWLSDLRGRVADSADITLGVRELGNPVWSPPNPADVRVIFAGDLGGYRLALVAGNWEPAEATPNPGRRQTLGLQRWFVGPAGAAAEDLLPGSGAPTVDSPTLAAQTIQPGSLPKSTAPMKRAGVTVAIVSSKAEVEAGLAGPAAYTREGEASLPLPLGSITATEPGVYTAPIPADGAYRLVVDGSSPATGVLQEVRDQDPNDPTVPEGLRNTGARVVSLPTDFSLPVSGVDPVLPAGLKPQRGGLTPPREVLHYAFGRAALYSGLSARDSSYQLISARPGLDARGNVNEWTVTTAVTAPGGARFVSVCEVLTGGRGVWNQGLDAWKVVPNGSLDSLALAWPVSGVDQKTVTPMGLIAILGPRAAVSAEVLGPDGQSVGTVALTGQVEAVDFNHKPLTTVRFLDAGGKVLAVAKVSKYMGGYSLEDAATDPPVLSWPTSAR